MKKIFLLTLVISLPLMGCPKKLVIGEMTKKVQQLEIPGADVDFKNMMIGVAMEIDGCTLQPEDCENLIDPWKSGMLLTLQKQIEFIKNDENSAEVQLKMAQWERAMLDGEGGDLLTYNNTFTTFSYHPGYGLENIKKRMEKYIALLSKSTD